MIQFAEVFPDEKIVVSLIRELSWTHFLALLPLKETPIGIIPCTGKDRGRIKLLELDKAGIHVAEYLAVLPPKDVLQRKLQEAAALSRARIENKRTDAE